MLALSTIALLVAGSSATELRGATETTSVETTPKFNVKRTGLIQRKMPGEEPPAPTGKVDPEARGYILEWTRVNTDCSGRVEFVGGLSSGATHSIMESEVLTTGYTNAYVDTNAQTYSMELFTSNGVDGDAGSTYGVKVDAPRCTQTISQQIPFDAVRLEDHQGYFYGHTFMKGEYSAVTNSLKGFYHEMYGSKNECLLGVQPIAFGIQWVKGECYFNSNTLIANPKQNLMDTPIKHDWFKIHSVGKDDGKIDYAIYNNDECVDKNPFDKAKVEQLDATPTIGMCHTMSNADITAQGVMWYKYMAY